MGRLRQEKSMHRISTPDRTVGESVTHDNIARICNQNRLRTNSASLGAVGRPPFRKLSRNGLGGEQRQFPRNRLQACVVESYGSEGILCSPEVVSRDDAG
jgi:hypothetical protein